ncbi:hypothetical protein IRJ41_019013, partial [Triplophysa rosa]
DAVRYRQARLLCGIRQGNRDIDDYADRFLEVAEETVFGEEELTTLFNAGLREPLSRAEMRSLRPLDFDTLWHLRGKRERRESWGSSSEASNPEPPVRFTSFLQPATGRVARLKRKRQRRAARGRSHPVQQPASQPVQQPAFSPTQPVSSPVSSPVQPGPRPVQSSRVRVGIETGRVAGVLLSRYLRCSSPTDETGVTSPREAVSSATVSILSEKPRERDCVRLS